MGFFFFYFSLSLSLSQLRIHVHVQYYYSCSDEKVLFTWLQYHNMEYILLQSIYTETTILALCCVGVTCFVYECTKFGFVYVHVCVCVCVCSSDIWGPLLV